MCDIDWQVFLAAPISDILIQIKTYFYIFVSVLHQINNLFTVSLELILKLNHTIKSIHIYLIFS